MKKFLKITGIVLAVILALLIILPIAFKGKIVERIKTAINENVDAHVEFGGFGISFFRNFPDVSFRLNDLTVVGKGDFEGDTLASVEKFFISVNVKSLFGNDGFEIKTMRIDGPRILLKVLEDGQMNWDLVPADDAAEPAAEEAPAGEDDFKLALRRLQINNAYFVYDDRDMDFYMRIENLTSTMRGDLTLALTTLQFRNTTADKVYMTFEGIPMLAGVSADLTADIDMDIDGFAFAFRDNTLKLNDLEMQFEGDFAWPAEDMILDIRFASPQSTFKSLLSIIPAVYMADFEGLTTSGSFTMNGYVKGIYNDDMIPGFAFNLDVTNGMFQYPDLPAAVTGVNISTSITSPGGDPDLTVIDVRKFALNAGGNPVEMKLNLQTPVSDPQIDAFLKGRLDLATVKNFFPLEEGEALSGIIESDITAKGKMSDIENERYNDFLFTGNFSINGLSYTSADFPQGIDITTASMNFSPQFAQLTAFQVKTGESDIAATGRIDNILGFALNDETIRGRFETRSSFFNLNQFMGDDETPDEPAQDESMELSVIEIPANIDFLLQSRFDRILFGDLEITNATGAFKVADQKVSMDNLRMNLLGGTLVLNGSYATPDVKNPQIDFGLDITNFDLQKTFTTFNTFAIIAPLGEKAHGNFSAGFNLKALLDEKLEPVVPSLAGGGVFRSSSITIDNSAALIGLAENLKMDMFKSLNVRDVVVNFVFRDGRVNVSPFDVNFGNSKATVSGNHGFDQTINYLLAMAIPRSEFGGAANQALDNLVSQAAGRGINITPAQVVNVGVGLTGTVSEPRVSVTLAQTAQDARQAAQQAIQDAVNEIVTDIREQARETIDAAREQISEEVERRAQQVVQEAERQAENIRREAKNSADAIRREAREQAKRAEDEASNPLAKTAARRAGETLIKSADERADQLETEADQRATRLVNDARTRADRIRAGQE